MIAANVELPRYARPLACVAVISVLALVLLAACGDDDEGGPAPPAGDDVGVDTTSDDVGVADLDEPEIAYPESGVSVRFDLEAALTDSFFAFPYPSDLRLRDDGTVDLTSFPIGAAVSDLLEQAVDVYEETVEGYSAVSAIYFGFEGALDPESLPADPIASLEADASVFVVDIDPDSPWFGRRHPVNVHYRRDEGRYWDADVVVMQPLFGFPLRAGTTYGAVVTTAVRSDDGRPAIGPESFRALLDASLGPADPELAELYAPLIEVLGLLGVDPNTVSAATVFTTNSPASDLYALRGWMHETLPTPEAHDLFLADDGTDYDVYEGTFPSEEFLDGDPPYRRFGSGTISIGPGGEPATRTPVDLTFALAVPSGEMPDAGWPVVLYNHGTGGWYLSMDGSTARELARRGVAVMGINQPLHGDRNPTDVDAFDLVISLTVSNIVIGRDMLRQGVADDIQATRLLRQGIVIPAEVAASGEEIRTDPDRVAFLGHSQGAQVGALFLAVEPDVIGGALSEGAGGAAISLLQRKANDIDIEEVVTVALGLDPELEPLELYHPAVGVVIQPLLEPADPLVYARHIWLDPFGGLPHDFAMTAGLQDDLAPPSGIIALGSAASLPVAEPLGDIDMTTFLVQGVGSVALPVSENLPEVGGVRATGALLPYPHRGHFALSRDDGARHQIYEFLASMLAGSPYLPAIEDR